jgi:hypothetical protein
LVGASGVRLAAPDDALEQSRTRLRGRRSGGAQTKTRVLQEAHVNAKEKIAKKRKKCENDV